MSRSQTLATAAAIAAAIVFLPPKPAQAHDAGHIIAGIASAAITAAIVSRAHRSSAPAYYYPPAHAYGPYYGAPPPAYRYNRPHPNYYGRYPYRGGVYYRPKGKAMILRDRRDSESLSSKRGTSPGRRGRH